MTSLHIPWDLYPDFDDLPNIRQSDEGPKPATLVKLTTLADKGLAVGVAFHHCLTDTQSLMTFMRDWSDIHRQLARSAALTLPNRLFQPLLL